MKFIINAETNSFNIIPIQDEFNKIQQNYGQLIPECIRKNPAFSKELQYAICGVTEKGLINKNSQSPKYELKIIDDTEMKAVIIRSEVKNSPHLDSNEIKNIFVRSIKFIMNNGLLNVETSEIVAYDTKDFQKKENQASNNSESTTTYPTIIKKTYKNRIYNEAGIQLSTTDYTDSEGLDVSVEEINVGNLLTQKLSLLDKPLMHYTEKPELPENYRKPNYTHTFRTLDNLAVITEIKYAYPNKSHVAKYPADTEYPDEISIKYNAAEVFENGEWLVTDDYKNHYLCTTPEELEKELLVQFHTGAKSAKIAQYNPHVYSEVLSHTMNSIIDKTNNSNRGR